MLLLGLLLVAYQLGLLMASQFLPLLLVGVGIIFSILALLKSRAPAKYEMSPRVTLGYGALAIIIGALWISVSVQASLALYVLAFVLVFFGVIFLAYTRFR